MAIPALQRVGCGNGREVFEVFSRTGMSQHRQSSALDVSERNVFALEFRFQNAVFFAQVGDGMTLVEVEFVSEPGDQEWHDHGLTPSLQVPTL